MLDHSTNLFLIALIVIWVISRQLRPRKLSKLTLFLLPVIALYFASQNLPHGDLPTYQIAEFILIVGVAILGGIVQARYTRVYQDGDQLYIQGNKITLFAWLLLIAVRFGINFAFYALFAPAGSPFSVLWILWIGVAVMFGTRNVLLYRNHSAVREMLVNRGQA